MSELIKPKAVFLDVHGTIADMINGVPVEGAADFIRFLLKENIKVGLVSTSRKEDIENALRNILKLEESEIKNIHIEAGVDKPSPEKLLLACRILGISPEQAWFVGDSPEDIICGWLGGCHAVGFRQNYLSSGEGKISADGLFQWLSQSALMQYIVNTSGQGMSAAELQAASNGKTAQNVRNYDELQAILRPFMYIGDGRSAGTGIRQ